MMDDLCLAAVTARVVAWHNRHPLARRIAPSHVHGVGYVGLPFAGAAGAAASAPGAAVVDAAAVVEGADPGAPDGGAVEGGSLRERALARARQQAAGDAGLAALVTTPPAPAGPAGAAPGTDAPLPDPATLQADFSQRFIDTLRPRDVARFAARAGQVLTRPPGDGPVREVRADGAHPGRQPARVYVLTAVIETGTRKSRVLLGTGLMAPVLGQRILDTPRVAALAGGLALAVGWPVWLMQPADAPGAVPGAPAAAAAPLAGRDGVAEGTPAALAAVGPAVPAAGPAEPVGDVAVPAAMSAALPATPAVVAAVVASAPAMRPGDASPGVAPSIRPVISDEDKARARQMREAMNAARPTATASGPGASAAVAAAAPPPKATAGAATRDPGSVLPAAPAGTFALSTRALRTRAEAEQVQVAMRSLLRTVGTADVTVDLLPQGDDWRVVALPFTQRAAADKARALLVSRGMRVDVVDF